MTIWLDVETNKALLRLREVKAVREVGNGSQKRIQDFNQSANSEC
jgi:hypothetical protein